MSRGTSQMFLNTIGQKIAHPKVYLIFIHLSNSLCIFVSLHLSCLSLSLIFAFSTINKFSYFEKTNTFLHKKAHISTIKRPKWTLTAKVKISVFVPLEDWNINPLCCIEKTLDGHILYKLLFHDTYE